MFQDPCAMQYGVPFLSPVQDGIGPSNVSRVCKREVFIQSRFKKIWSSRVV
jgi:hypothetical protein